MHTVASRLIEVQADHIPTNPSRTPLAASLCDAVDIILDTAKAAASQPDQHSAIRRVISLQSDGDHNFDIDTSRCVNDDFVGPISYEFSQPNWNIPEASWQLPTTKRGFFPDKSAEEAIEGSELPLADSGDTQRPLTEANLKWRVGLEFAFCTPAEDYAAGSAEPCVCLPNPHIDDFADHDPADWCLDADHCEANDAFDPQNPGLDVPVCKLKVLAPSPTGDTSGLPSPPAVPAYRVPLPVLSGEYDFFAGLGQSTPDSEFEEIGYLPRAAYGVARSVAGDVNLDGCVDREDYEDLTDDEVFDHRALPGRSETPMLRADLDQDGWVTPQDRRLVLENLGRGCTDADLVPDPFPNARLDLQVRNLYRGNDACRARTFTPQFKVVNHSDRPFSLSGVNIRMFFDNAFDEAIELVWADYVPTFDRHGYLTGSYAQVSALETEPPDHCDAVPGRGATQTHHLQLQALEHYGDGTIPPRGGFAIVSAQFRRSGGAWPFDAECNDFSRLSPSNRFRDDPHFALVQPSAELAQVTLCEYKSPTEPDPNSGLDAGVLACGRDGCSAPPDCGSDSDCGDGDDCTIHYCDEGACVIEFVHGDCSDDGDDCTDDVCVEGVCTHPDNGTCSTSCNGQAWSNSKQYRRGDRVVERCLVNFPGTPCYGHQGQTFTWRCDAPTWCNIEPGSNAAGWWTAWTPVAECG